MLLIKLPVSAKDLDELFEQALSVGACTPLSHLPLEFFRIGATLHGLCQVLHEYIRRLGVLAFHELGVLVG